jgi:hypothetical protein
MVLGIIPRMYIPLMNCYVVLLSHMSSIVDKLSNCSYYCYWYIYVTFILHFHKIFKHK